MKYNIHFDLDLSGLPVKWGVGRVKILLPGSLVDGRGATLEEAQKDLCGFISHMFRSFLREEMEEKSFGVEQVVAFNFLYPRAKPDGTAQEELTKYEIFQRIRNIITERILNDPPSKQDGNTTNE